MIAIAARKASGSRTNARPLSNGTLSHLCASVAQESAPSMPAVRWRSAGAAAAHRPKAASTWTQAPVPRACSTTAAIGSTAPVFTLPACTHRIVGPAIGGSASARIRPCASAGTRSTRLRPRPSRPSDLIMLGWASPPTTTVIGGAPNRPSASTFQPVRASTAWRAAARAVKLATVAPVTKAPPVPAGRPVMSTSQRSATCSRCAVPGVTAYRAQFWSHAPASQFAASVTGSEPPMTKPKKRGPAIAMVAGATTRSSKSSVAAASPGPSGRGSSSTDSAAVAAADGATARPASESR